MWVVVVVDTNDDYKPSWSSWSEVREPRIFTTTEARDKYLRSFYVSYIHDHIENYYLEEDGKLASYRDYFTRGLRVKRALRTSLSDLEEIAQKLAVGRYIPSTLAVTVHQVEADGVIEEFEDSGDEE